MSILRISCKTSCLLYKNLCLSRVALEYYGLCIPVERHQQQRQLKVEWRKLSKRRYWTSAQLDFTWKIPIPIFALQPFFLWFFYVRGWYWNKILLLACNIYMLYLFFAHGITDYTILSVITYYLVWLNVGMNVACSW